jgi:hypothetical protein
MSPEQVDGKPLDGGSKLLSFGVVPCEMAAGGSMLKAGEFIHSVFPDPYSL